MEGFFVEVLKRARQLIRHRGWSSVSSSDHSRFHMSDVQLTIYRAVYKALREIANPFLGFGDFGALLTIIASAFEAALSDKINFASMDATTRLITCNANCKSEGDALRMIAKVIRWIEATTFRPSQEKGVKRGNLKPAKRR